MSRDDDFHVRLGRARNQGRGVNKPFVGRVLASAHKAGGLSTGRRRGSRSTFGRGRAAAFIASRSLTDRSRHVVVKARVVRQEGWSISTALGTRALSEARWCHQRRRARPHV
jgi:hypothetical protein